MDGYGDPVYGDDLDSALDQLFDVISEYANSHITQSEVQRADFGVEVYWPQGGADRFILATVYDRELTYFSVGYSTELGDEETVEVGFVRMENMSDQLEAARDQAENLDTVVLE